MTVGAVIVLVLGFPYRLHLESLRLEKPVVVFSARIWRALPLTLLFSGLALLLIGVALSISFRNHTNSLDPLILLVPTTLVCWGVVISIRLHHSYWKHDREATLVIDTLGKRATYSNQEVHLDFAFSEVVNIVQHSCRWGRAPWGHYGYEVLRLSNGTDILVTCLFYSLLGPERSFSKATCTLEKHRVCWLPTSE
ncbi:MAG: hypothetical protein JWR44_322 [Hymenobacter sp.]|nr:hypothetical protein [Hymenobacter sp.]